MKAQTVIDNDFAIVTYFSDLKMIHIVWKNKAIDFTEYQKIYKTCLVLQRTNPVHFTLSDVTQQVDLPSEYNKWLVDFILPIAIRQGIQRMGVITSANVQKLQQINNVFKSSKQLGIPLKAFKQEEAAREWLFSAST